ncbi:rod shape-determining protein [Alkalibacter saccharofermentans]|uniref:Cell shape-determining protein MreB n=1 Tax=Alkalibacter saccharofermentans DSM 14828 TaxID=1120975 RepID=A0A1M5A4Q5_9FIRM|nr:rod shape-determining protein MreB [Alkalibacter saccharofermentans]SHF25300.1 rod shape-determining protein MreB [Alkalibacter saccharofermentans DSM 14828]
MAPLRKDIGIDLGTANVLVYVKGKGIVLQEPSVVAIDTNTNEIKAIGADARAMLGRTPGNIQAIRPLRDGVISDFKITERMLKYFIAKVCGNKRFLRPRVVVGIPSGATEVEKRAVEQAVLSAGGTNPVIVEEPVAAAIGAGIDITQPTGNMVVDIGGGTTDVAVLSLGGIVESISIKIAGDRFDESIVRYMRKSHNVLIGERTAEDLKINIGSAYPAEEETTMDIRGRDLLSGLPKTITVTSEEIRIALSDNIGAVINAIHGVLERTPPELAADISDTGIYLAGGGALLKGLDILISDRMGVPVNIVENAESSVAFGTGKILDNVHILGSGTGKKSYD